MDALYLLPSTYRFLEYIKENNDSFKNELETKERHEINKSKFWDQIRVSTLVLVYDSWCQSREEEREPDHVFFYHVEKQHKKTRKRHGYVFDLSALHRR